MWLANMVVVLLRKYQRRGIEDQLVDSVPTSWWALPATPGPWNKTKQINLLPGSNRNLLKDYFSMIRIHALSNHNYSWKEKVKLQRRWRFFLSDMGPCSRYILFFSLSLSLHPTHLVHKYYEVQFPYLKNNQ